MAPLHTLKLNLITGICLAMLGASPVSAWALPADGLPSQHYEDYDVEGERERLRDVRERHAVVSQKLKQAQSQLQAKVDQLRDLRQGRKQAEETIQQSQAQIQQLNQERQDNRTKIQSAKAELNQKRQQVNDIKPRINQLQNRKQQLDTEVQQAQAEVARQRQALEPIERQLQQARSNLEQNKRQLSENENAIRDTESGIDQNRNRKRQLESQAQQAKSSLSQAESEERQASQEVAQLKPLVERLKSKVNQLTDEIRDLRQKRAQAKQQGNEDKVKRLTARIRSTQEKRSAASSELKSKQDELRQAQSDVSRAEKAITAAKKAIQQSEREIPRLEAQLQKDQQKLVQLRGQKSSLAQAVQNSKQQVSRLESEYDQKKGGLVAAENKLRDAQSRLQSTAGQLKQLQSEANELERVAKRLELHIEQLQRRQQAIASDVQNLKSRIDSAQSRKREIAARLPAVKENVEELRLARDRLKERYDIVSTRLERQRYRLEQVEQNVRDADRIMERVAGDEGHEDGRQAGLELGQADGLRDGRQQGSDKGRADGEREGREREYNSGYARGRAQGEAQGQKDAEVNASADGRRDGSEQGKSDGLATAFKNGKRAGLDHGERTGDDRPAYQKGYNRGQQAGLDQAVSDAEPERKRGYQEKENEYLKAPLKEQVIKDAAVAANFSGLQASSGPSDDRYYRPRPRNYPHPRITEFYHHYYDLAYRDAKQSYYDSSYRTARDQAYEEHYERTRRDYANRSYPEEFESGRQTAYDEYYRQTYDRVYASEYARQKQHYYQLAYDQYKNDKSEYDRGFKAGNAIASEKKGYDEGYAKSYEDNLDKQKRLAYNQGLKSAETKYTQNPVIEVSSVSLLDSNSDGVYRPGEQAYVVLEVKNYGLKPLISSKSVVNVQGAAKAIDSGRVIPQLNGQSAVRVIGFGKIQVRSDASNESPFTTTVAFVNSSGSTIATKTFNNAAKFPYQISVSGFDGVLVPSIKTTIKLRVANRSQKVGAVDLQLIADASKVELGQNRISTGIIAANSQKLIEVAVTGKPEANFSSTEIGVSVAAGQVKVGEPLKIAATIIRRHQYNASSSGLLLAKDLSHNQAKTLFELVGDLDTWDIRVDGKLQKPETLANYKAKAVHVVASEDLRLDATSLSYLNSYLIGGGQVVVWAVDEGPLPLLQQLSLLDLKASSTYSLNEQLKSHGLFAGLNLAAQGRGRTLQSSKREVTSVLVGRGQVVGLTKVTSEFTSNEGRIVVLGVEPSALKASSIAGIKKRLVYLNLNFDERLNAATARPGLMGSILAELVEEAYTDDARTDVRWMKDERKSTKIYRSMQKVLKLKGPAHEIFRDAYPEVYKVAQAMSDSRARQDLMHLLESVYVGSGFFSKKSWRQYYCFEHGDHNKEWCEEDQWP